MQAKYTNEQLYQWYDKAVRDLSYQTYLMSIDFARKAEKAFLFERGPAAAKELAGSFLQSSYWDDGRDGALAAQRLSLDLRRLETEYMRKRSHDYEVTKTISLRQINPWALMNLQYNGVTEFEIPEFYFDLDFPGHYCRRIKSIAITIPSITGPYTNLGCSVRLMQHRYRLAMNNAGVGYYPEIPETDYRFTTDSIPVTAIAVSDGMNDAGQFELNLKDERWIPFEGAGALSKWRIELPETRLYDSSTISDFIIHMRYTSLEGGEGWRKTASNAAAKVMNDFVRPDTDGQFIMFDLKNDLPEYWYSLTRSPQKELSVPVTKLRNQMPFWTKGRKVTLRKVWVLINKGQSTWVPSGNTPATVFDQELTRSADKLGDMMVLETDGEDLQEVFEGEQTLDIKKEDTNGLGFERAWLLLKYTAV